MANPNPGKAMAAAPLGAIATARETAKWANAVAAHVQHAATPSAICAQRGVRGVHDVCGVERAGVARTA
jgi:hypothetical protein